MTEIITYIFEFVSMIISFLAFIILIKQRKNSLVSLGNTFLSLASCFIGIYALSTIIYSIIGEEWAIIFFLKLGMISIVLAVLFLYFTMQVLIYSSQWIKTYKIRFFLPLIITLIIITLLTFSDFIEVTDAATATTHFDPIIYNLFAVFVAFMLFYSTIVMYIFGVKRSTGDSKKRMMIFFIGLICIIFALISDVIGNIIEIEVLFDTLLFAFLTFGIIFVVITFLGKK